MAPTAGPARRLRGLLAAGRHSGILLFSPVTELRLGEVLHTAGSLATGFSHKTPRAKITGFNAGVPF